MRAILCCSATIDWPKRRGSEAEMQRMNRIFIVIGVCECVRVPCPPPPLPGDGDTGGFPRVRSLFQPRCFRGNSACESPDDTLCFTQTLTAFRFPRPLSLQISRRKRTLISSNAYAVLRSEEQASGAWKQKHKLHAAADRAPLHSRPRVRAKGS